MTQGANPSAARSPRSASLYLSFARRAAKSFTSHFATGSVDKGDVEIMGSGDVRTRKLVAREVAVKFTATRHSVVRLAVPHQRGC